MGKPSNRSRNAQRPGKRERARVKKHRRGKSYGSVSGAGTYTLKAGRKKWDEFHASRRNPFGMLRSLSLDLKYGETVDHVNGTMAHRQGNHIAKVGTAMPDGQTTRQAECNSPSTDIKAQ